MLNISPNNRKSTLLKKGIKDLNLQTKGELFVFKSIINNYHLNNYIVKYIEKIKLENGLIRVIMTTSIASNDFSVSDLKSDGWSVNMDEYDKKSYINGDIARKTAYR